MKARAGSRTRYGGALGPWAADTRGLSTAEYVIILALICIVGFVVWQEVGSHAAERNRAAGVVVDGLATSSHEGDHPGGGGGGGAGGDVGGPSAGSGAYPDIGASGEEGAGDDNLWKVFVVGGVFFGGMMLWLMKDKAGR